MGTNELIEEARRIAALSPNSDAGKCFTGLVAALEISAQEIADRKQSEGELVDMVNSLADERDALARTIERIKAARSNHPVCELYEGDDAVSCGWKSAVLDIDAALNKGDNNG